MNAPAWKFELVLAATLLAVGIVLLPVAIYWVGQFVVGPYEGERGIMGLLVAVWSELGSGRLAAWGLVLSPYLVVQLTRLARLLWRRSVNAVTVSADKY